MPRIPVDELRREIRELQAKLLKCGFVIQSNPPYPDNIGQGKVLVSWEGGGPLVGVGNDFCTVAEYQSFLAARQFSVILFDGSIIQIAYTLKNQEIIGHRLAYIPCPVVFSSEVLEVLSVEDYIDSIPEAEFRAGVRMVAPLRFDFSLEAQAPMHPASHFTAGKSSCRLPVSAPVSLKRFMRFVLHHYYPEFLNDPDFEFIHTGELERWTPTIEAHEKSLLFLQC